MPRQSFRRPSPDPRAVARRLLAAVRRAAPVALLVAAASAPAFAGPVGEADLSIEKTDFPDPVTAGEELTYTIIASNFGPDPAIGASWSDALPTGVTFVSLSPSEGWSCTTPSVGDGGEVECSNASFPQGSASFTLVVLVDSDLESGTELVNTATLSAETPDPSEVPPSTSTTTTLVADTADLVVTKQDDPDPVDPGGTITYEITVTNNGPSDAGPVTLDDTLPAVLGFQSLASPPGWTCSTPAVGDPGPISCSVASLPPGQAAFTLVVTVDDEATPGSFIQNAATASSQVLDPNEGDETGNALTLVTGGPDYSILKSDSPDPVLAGGELTYTITATSEGVDPIASVEIQDELPAGTTFQSLVAAAGWTCVTPDVGTHGTVTCSIASMPSGDAVFTLVVEVSPDTAAGSVLANVALMLSATPEPDSNDNSATALTDVAPPPAPALAVSKTASGDFTAGGAVTYTLVVTNTGTGAQPDNPGDELTDVLPPELVLVSATATSGMAVATVATGTVTWNGAVAEGGSVTITIEALIRPEVAPGTTVENQASFLFDADGDGTNEAGGVSDDPGEAGSADPTSFVVAGGGPTLAEIPTLGSWGALALALMLALAGGVWLARR